MLFVGGKLSTRRIGQKKVEKGDSWGRWTGIMEIRVENSVCVGDETTFAGSTAGGQSEIDWRVGKAAVSFELRDRLPRSVLKGMEMLLLLVDQDCLRTNGR